MRGAAGGASRLVCVVTLCAVSPFPTLLGLVCLWLSAFVELAPPRRRRPRTQSLVYAALSVASGMIALVFAAFAALGCVGSTRCTDDDGAPKPVWRIMGVCKDGLAQIVVPLLSVVVSASAALAARHQRQAAADIDLRFDAPQVRGQGGRRGILHLSSIERGRELLFSREWRCRRSRTPRWSTCWCR